jgi:hypothetical protein
LDVQGTTGACESQTAGGAARRGAGAKKTLPAYGGGDKFRACFSSLVN